MNGNLKVLEVSIDNFLIKRKRTYKNVNIHFRDLQHHTIKLSNGKSIILSISGVSIEAESLLLEGDAYAEVEELSPEEYEDIVPVMVELRFYPEKKRLDN